MMRKITIGLLVFLVIFILGRVYYRATDDFRLGNMTHNTSPRFEWNTAPLDTEQMAVVRTILDQPYRYLGKGAQSYAFLSEDGNYVLKFFKFKHLRQASWVSYVPKISILKEWVEDDKAKKRAKTKTFSMDILSPITTIDPKAELSISILTQQKSSW